MKIMNWFVRFKPNCPLFLYGGYFIIYINNTPEKKKMVLELVNLDDSKHNSYKVYFEQEEILEFVNLSRNIA